MARGRTVSITWEGRRADAFVPEPLAELTFELPERVVRGTERAAAALQRADDRIAHRFGTLARLLLRAEGLASSQIEGVHAPAELVAVAEVNFSSGSPKPVYPSATRFSSTTFTSGPFVTPFDRSR